MNCPVKCSHFNLNWNQIGDNGAIVLADALKVNPSITSINLKHNSIGNDGAAAIAEALKVNPSITNINLNWNRIGTVKKKAIDKELNTNQKLLELSTTKLLNQQELSNPAFQTLRAHLDQPSAHIYNKKTLNHAFAKQMEPHIGLPSDVTYHVFSFLGPSDFHALVRTRKLLSKADIDDSLTDQSIHTGIWTGNVIASPFIRYLDDQLDNQNQKKSLIDYYAEQFTLKKTIKSIVFSVNFFALPNYFSIANKVLIAKMSSDISVNVAQLSVEYATSALFELATSFTAFSIVIAAKQSLVYQNHPFAIGLLASTAGDLTKLSYDTAYVCYDLMIG